MEDAREERARVALKATTGGAGRRKKGSTGGVMLHHGGCFDSDDQTTSPVTPLPEEERTHVPDLHQNTSPAPEVVSKGQASSASSPEEEYSRRGRRFLAHDGGVLVSGEAAPVAALEPPPPEEDCGRERLKRHRVAMAGRVWIPEIWGQETLLRDWIDCAVIDRALVPSGLLSARKALVEECRRANSGRCLST